MPTLPTLCISGKLDWPGQEHLNVFLSGDLSEVKILNQINQIFLDINPFVWTTDNPVFDVWPGLKIFPLPASELHARSLTCVRGTELPIVSIKV